MSTVQSILAPKAIAVIGASRNRGTVGGELFHNLLHCGFTGPVYPVHPTARVVQSVLAYADVRVIPDDIDLAIVAVPATHAAAALDACGEKGVRAAVVITAGFKETGALGAAREAELRARGRAYGMRIVGPNCLGVVNTDPAVRMNATFVAGFPRPGPVAFASQSGALGAVVLQLAERRGIGLSSFVSLGNKCDVSGNDLLEWWEHDDRTRVILMYLESFGNPRRFTQIARRVATRKPIIVVKSGRTAAGSRAAASHTGALAGTDVAVDALLRQAGVVRVDTTEEMFDTSMLLATQPIPAGKRLAIITNAGGPGIMATDACESAGLDLASLSSSTQRQLTAFLPAEASVRNPVDMIASATAEQYGRAASTVLADPNVDALLVIFVPPLMVEVKDVARAIGRAADGASKPIAACYMGAYGFPQGLWSENDTLVPIPSYRFPESAVRALGHAVSYGQWLRVADSPIPNVTLDAAAASATVEACREGLGGDPDPQWLDPGDVDRLLEAYGINTPAFALAESDRDAVALANDMGYPVVMKLVSDRLLHKANIGGVLLDRRDEDEVREGFSTLIAKAEAAGLRESVRGVMVQRFVNEGVEAVLGAVQDPAFGPLIMFGLGGADVELVRDVVFRLHPLTEHDIDTMIRSVRASRLLDGYRGAPPGDVLALRDLIARVSRLITDVPELLEMDLNPVKILPPGRGCIVVDARIRLGPASKVPRS